jgi:hypothetical protein
VAALEVTSDMNSERLALEAEVERQGLESFRLPSLRMCWIVRLSSTARVRSVDKEALQSLLSDLEVAGKRHASDMGDAFRDPSVQRLRNLAIETVWGYDPKPGREGTAMVRAGTYGAFGWTGSDVDDWLQALLASTQGVNKLKKLARATAAERHLVVVLDPFTKAGLGIPVALTDRHDRGAAEFEMPSVAPPQPLTHTWILPRGIADEGLIWTREAGWSTFTLPPIGST